MKRLPDWEPRLIAYLHENHKKPFQAGVHDCAIFTAGAVQAMTGEDLASQWIGQYGTIVAGIKALKKAGFDDHVALVASMFTEIHPAFCHKGDIAVVDGDFGFGALGIVQGESVYVLTTDGMAIVNRMKILRAFKT